MKLRCWWFGCRGYNPDYDDLCGRCGQEIPYHDLVGDTRHEYFKFLLKYWFYRKWIPEKCKDCNKRYGRHTDCDEIPF